MLNVLAGGGGIRFCDGMTRREAIQVGGLGTLGLGLGDLLRGRAQAAGDLGGTFGQAKRVILLFMWGGPAHQDIWDLKPEAPAETRGEFRPIATNVPGIHIGEHFPLIARHADKLAIIRSVGQTDNNHSTGAHASLTGRKHLLAAESFGARDSDHPHIGSVLSKLRPSGSGMPTFVALPELIATTNGAVTPGQGGGFLGKKYDPFRIDRHPEVEGFSVPGLTLPETLRGGRMGGRRGLLQQVERLAGIADQSASVQAMDAFYRQALDMVLSPKAARAFDLAAESEGERARYGWHTFGQSLLLARRLIEAGTSLVTVYWHRERPTIDTTWDTHGRNFEELKSRLMPSVDRPIAALFEDLQARGLLDETLVIWNSEFGRTPRINRNGGRDHWGACNSVVLAGGGVPGGQVFGASDEQAAYPARDKVTQDDIAATVFHLLGLEKEKLIFDRLNRPYPLALGEPIAPLLGGLSRPTPTPAPTLIAMPETGPFLRMLRERGNRYLAVEMGNAESEKQWRLTGWSEPTDVGPARHRAIGSDPVTIRYKGIFLTHFAYGSLALRLAEPTTLAGVKLSVGGVELTIPDTLRDAEPRRVWQIPVASGPLRSAGAFELRLEAPGWKVTDLALCGEAIDQRHLAMIEA